MTMKCRICGNEKPECDFAFTGYTRKRDGMKTRKRCCKACAAKETRGYRESHPGYAGRKKTEWRARERFKQALLASKAISKIRGYMPCVATEDEIVAAFTGYCCNCGKKEDGRKLHLDHDHTTGEFRGWLCNGCNRRDVLSKKQLEKAA